jgi:hypothetical protein
MKILIVNPYRSEKPNKEKAFLLRDTQLWDSGTETYDYGFYL